MKFKYGIVIVTYNRLNLLKECVECCIRQTQSPEIILIIDNCSTDGTREYLAELSEKQKVVHVIRLEQNTGGAGGFYRGMVEAIKSDIDWVMLIDDDAILNYDCMEKMNPLNARNKSEAYACVVKSHGKIDLDHRRTLNGQLAIDECSKKEIACQYATFCGLMISVPLIKEIGFPEKDYFIWFDDTEYCMRINKRCNIIICTDAHLNHKTVPVVRKSKHEIASWKTYYGVRNKIHALRKHNESWNLVKDVCKNTNIIFVKLVRSITGDKSCRQEAKLFWDAMRDGLRGQLGKNEKYLPGGKKE